MRNNTTLDPAITWARIESKSKQIEQIEKHIVKLIRVKNKRQALLERLTIWKNKLVELQLQTGKLKLKILKTALS